MFLKRPIVFTPFKVILLPFVILFFSCSKNNSDKVYKYINANVYVDGEFVEKDIYSIGEQFSFKYRGTPDSVIDLEYGYIIPPFGDAHTHNFDGVEYFDSLYSAYLDEGVFYIQVLNNSYSGYQEVKELIENRKGIDVLFSHGGITSTGGHPQNGYESAALNLDWRVMFTEEGRKTLLESRILADDAYYLIDTVEDLRTKWEQIISRDPDIVKVMILNSKTREQLVEQQRIGSYGVSKEVLNEVVEYSKKSNKRVYAHIQNAADFELAIDAGVRYFAHMPGYGGGLGDLSYDELALSDSLLNTIKLLDVTIIPTISFAKYYARSWTGNSMAVDSALLKEKNDFIRTELKRYEEAGINIMLGTDQHQSTLREEIDDIISLGVYSNKRLLEILINTPQILYPNRRISAIAPGYEASFLVLKNNPIEDIKSIFEINLKVKKGEILN